MPMPKGTKIGEKRKGSGRPPGRQNKLTVNVKKAIYEAFEMAGGAEYLLKVAKEDPKTFCTLLGKVLPTEVANADDKALVISWQK